MKKYLLLSLLFIVPMAGIWAQMPHVPGEVMVQLVPGGDIRQLAAQLETLQGIPTRVSIVKELSKPVRIWLLSFDPAAISEQEFLQAIKRQPETAEAQFNHLLQMRSTVPDDPNFNQQWQWVNNGQGGGTADADVDADLAWDITTGGTTANGDEIVVCVVEGTNRNHTDLQGNLWFNIGEIPNNGIDDDENGYVDDYRGWNVQTDTDNINSEDHGTSVSGMIGAKGNNGTLITGINWDVKIMNVDFSGVSEANSIEAYTYPLIMRKRYNESGGTEGAFVVATNSSWGIDNGDPDQAPLWCAFYDSLGAVGILSCGSTANNDVNIDVVGDLPTGCTSEFLISVTATNNKDVRTFSAFGLEHVDIAAPGEDIVSIGQNGGPVVTSGTSFASPLTAGVIGLLYSAPCFSLGPEAIGDPAGTALKIRDALFNGVDVVPNLVGEIKYGGRVNAYNSLLLLQDSCSRCPKPFGIRVEALIDTSAIIQWVSTDSTLNTNFRIRQVGELAWDTLTGASSPLVLDTLQSCTTYEFQLEDVCSDTSSGFTASIVFKTDGCCEPPSELEIYNITETGALASWNPVLAANAYNVKLETSEGEIVLENILNTFIFFSNLDSCTVYSVQIQTVCDTGLTVFGPVATFTTKGCGACLDETYCDAKAADATGEWIDNVSLNTLDNSSGSDGGYGDYTGLSTDLATYTQYTISLSPGFSGFSFNERWSVWIDFNQDGEFDNIDERVFNSPTSSSTTVTGTILIPGDALPGLTRMRVIMRFNQSPSGACDLLFNYGEVEDYCVNIVEGTPPVCTPPLNHDTTIVNLETASLAWDTVADAVAYDVRVKGTAAANWTIVTVDEPAVVIQNLDPCTEYEYQVRSVCIGTESSWSDSFIFMTDCVSSQQDRPRFSERFKVRPNPFTSAIWVEAELAQNQPVKLLLYNVWGQLIMEQEYQAGAGTNTLKLGNSNDLQQLSAGVYLLKIQFGNSFFVEKLVKE